MKRSVCTRSLQGLLSGALGSGDVAIRQGPAEAERPVHLRRALRLFVLVRAGVHRQAVLAFGDIAFAPRFLAGLLVLLAGVDVL